MKFITCKVLPPALLVFMAMIVPVHASTIPIAYSLVGVGTVVDSTDTTLTLQAEAAGSFLSGNPALDTSWNPVSYTDLSVLDFTTNLLNGSFTLSFADGDTLTGNVFEDDSAVDASPTQTGPFSQTLTITGGTGALAGATGSLSGEGFLGTTDFTVSGSGAIDASAVPEPSSAALLLGGLALVIAGACRPFSKSVSGDRIRLSGRI